MADSGRDGYDVGYRKPPRKHQFKKGASGNPRGRPRKPKEVPLQRSLNPFLDTFIKEMERVVPIREGGELVELTVFEAAVRQLAVKAIRGDHRALKLLLEHRKAAEAERLDEMANQIQCVDRYKAEWGPRFAHAKARGLPEPDQLPHPDHVSISRKTGLIEITGPDSPELKEWWDSVKSLLRVVDRHIATATASLAEKPKDTRRKEILRLHQSTYRKLLKQVPPGWNWREEIGDRSFELKLVAA